MGLAGATLGGSVVMTRVGLGEMPAFGFIALRMSLATLAFAIGLAVFRPPPPEGRRMWVDIALIGVLNTAVPLTLFTLSLQYMSSGVVALFVALVPLSTGLMAHLSLPQERLSRRRLGGLLLAFAGVGVLLLTGTTGLPTRMDPRGPALGLSGVLLSSFATVYARRHLQRAPVVTLTAIQTFVAAVILIPAGLLTSPIDLRAISPTGWTAVAFTGLIGSGLAFLLFFQLIREFGATTASESTYLAPPIAGALGVLLLDEVVSPALLSGAMLILVGVYLSEGGPGQEPTA
jgi:drug/metabolite transporter (DMT)-like permease